MTRLWGFWTIAKLDVLRRYVDEPPFTRIRLFELGSKASALEDRLRSDFPHRDLKVYEGDCNQTIPRALDELRILNWAPTFAFVDPNAIEARWETVQELARFKQSGKPKVELFLLFSPPMFVRLLPSVGVEQMREKDAARIDALFGSDEWRPIYRARVRDIEREASGEMPLFELADEAEPVRPHEKFYEHEPPKPPRTYGDEKQVRFDF